MKRTHDRFIKNYEKIQIPADNKKGYRIKLRYKGLWYSWEMTAQEKKSRNIRYLLMEAVSIAAFITAALQPVGLNTGRVAAAISVLSLIPWIAELWGVFRFVTARTPMMESDFEEIRKGIRFGCPVRAALIAAALVTGIIELLVTRKFSPRNMISVLLFLLSAAASYMIYRDYLTLRYSLRKSEDGKPGGKA